MPTFEEEFAAALQESHDAFMGQHKEAVGALSGLSRAEIDAIVPGALDLQKYDELMLLVRKASSRNMDSAELAGRIRDLGEVAVDLLHPLAAALPNLRRVLSERFCFFVLLLSVVEQASGVLFDVEHEALATALRGNPCRHAKVAAHDGPR